MRHSRPIKRAWQTLQKKWARDSAIMSQSDADSLKRQIDTLDRSIKRTRESMRDDLSSRATIERDRIWRLINNTVVEYARSQGYDLIVPSPVVYASPRIDITDAVLERLAPCQDARRNKTMSSATLYSLAALAARFGLELRGDGDTSIRGVGTLSDRDAAQLSFLANPRYRGQLADIAPAR